MENIYLQFIKDDNEREHERSIIKNFKNIDGLQKYNLYKRIKGETAISISKFRGLVRMGYSLNYILEKGGDKKVKKYEQGNYVPGQRVKEENKTTERQLSYIKQCIELGYTRSEIIDNPILKGISSAELSYHFSDK